MAALLPILHTHGSREHARSAGLGPRSRAHGVRHSSHHGTPSPRWGLAQPKGGREPKRPCAARWKHLLRMHKCSRALQMRRVSALLSLRPRTKTRAGGQRRARPQPGGCSCKLVGVWGVWVAPRGWGGKPWVRHNPFTPGRHAAQRRAPRAVQQSAAPPSVQRAGGAA